MLLLAPSLIPSFHGTTGATIVFLTSGTILYSQTPEPPNKPYVDGITIRDSSGAPLILKGFIIPRDTLGNNTWMVPVFQDYF